MLALALVALILEKLGLKVSGARCADCRRRVQHGHRFCYDHLRERTFRAQERFHGQRGAGF
jgi:recombinational DNA repair protein (RecF pathway)